MKKFRKSYRRFEYQIAHIILNWMDIRGMNAIRIFGGGGLYLAIKMLRTLHLQPNDLVLDLGCGKALWGMRQSALQ